MPSSNVDVDNRGRFIHWLGLGWAALFCWTMTALPTGNVGPVNLKMLVTLGGLVLILCCLIRNKTWSALSGLLWPSIWALGFLLTGTVAAVAYHVPIPMMSMQVKMLAAPLVVCGMGVAFVRLGLISDRGMLAMLVLAHVSYVLAKIGVSLALATGLMSWARGQALMSQVWPSPYFAISSMPGGWARMVLPTDLVSTVAIAVLLSWDRLRLVPRLPYVVIVVAVLLVAISAAQNVTRAIWVMMLLGVAIGCWMAWDRRRVITLVILYLALLAAIIGIPGLWALVHQRFSETTLIGESIRINETKALWNAFTQSWVWGHGWGYGLEGCVRNPQLPFDYEIQWVAWLMQCGVLGMSFAMTLIWMMSRQIRRLGPRGSPLLVLFGMWILAGFTNPLLHCSAAGVYVLMLILMTGILGDEAAQSL